MKKIFERLKGIKMENKLLLLALVCGLLAAITGYAFIAVKEAGMMKSMEPVKILVASKFITPKTRFSEDMVKEALLPAKFVTSAHIKDFKKLNGRMAMVPFIEGEPILLNKVSEKADELSGAVPTGLRAVAVGVDEETSVGYMIMPGDYVDVLLTYEKNEGKQAQNTTAVILQSAQVVAVGTDFNAASVKKYNTITLAVTPEEAELLTFAASRGRISFTLRPAGETMKEKIGITDFAGLLNQIRINGKGETMKSDKLPVETDEIHERE